MTLAMGAPRACAHASGETQSAFRRARGLVRPTRWALAASLLLLSACVSRPLSRPAILGASASAGFGAEVAQRDGRTVHVDLESVLLAALSRAGSDPIMLADPSFYVAPEKAAAEQAEAAATARPTLILALDYLFWSVYGSRFEVEAAGGGAEPVSRLESLEASLTMLDGFQAPIVVGDIPDVARAAGKGLPGSWIPAGAEIDGFNERVREWAAARPRVIVVALSEFAWQQPSAGDGAEAAILVQEDQLHPTALGLVELCLSALVELEGRGLIDAGDYRADAAVVMRRLPGKARAVASSRRGGPLAILRLLHLYREWEESIEAQDCQKAARIGQELFEHAAAYRTAPHDWADVAASFALLSYRRCPGAREHVVRWRERLAAKVYVSQPDPWPLQLWAVLNEALDEERATLDRLLEIRTAAGALPEGYRETVRDVYRDFVRSAPAEVMLLVSEGEVAARLERLESTVASAFERSREPIDERFVLKSAENFYREQMQEAETEEERARWERALRDMRDPLAHLERNLESAGLRYAELERALRAAGREEEAAAVRRAAEEGITAERYEAARAKLEEKIAEEGRLPASPPGGAGGRSGHPE